MSQRVRRPRALSTTAAEGFEFVASVAPVAPVAFAVLAGLGALTAVSRPTTALAWESCGLSARDVASLPAGPRYECAERELWVALQAGTAAARRKADTVLTRALGERSFPFPPAPPPEPLPSTAASRLHFYRGALRLAMALENRRYDLALLAPLKINPDFEAAVALDPGNDHFVSFLDSMHVAVPALLGDMRGATAAAERGLANVARNTLLNTLSLSGTTIGLPLSTGIPQKTIALLDAWRCEGKDFCERNTEKAPFARPGLAYHFGEAYARVGRLDDAERHFRAAIAAPGASEWPFTRMTREHLSDLPGYARRFADLGRDGSAMTLAYANREYGCVFCHGRAER